MGFHEVQFPTNVDYGSFGGPGFSTSIIETDSGREERIGRWASPRRRYNAAYTIRTFDDLYLVTEFYIARTGPLFGFRYKDWLDYTSSADGRTTPDDEDEVIGTGDGTATTFQLVKRYSSGGVEKTRTIEKPVDGTVVIALDGVAQTEGVNYSVNTTSGIVTFNSAPGSAVSITAGFEFDVPVRFGAEVDLALPSTIDNFSSGSIPDIPLVEIRGDVVDPESTWNGGAKDFGATAIAQSVTLADGRALRFSPTAAHDINLQSFVNIEPGGPIFLIINDGSETLTIKDHNAVTVVTVPAGAAAELWLSIDSGSVKSWYAK